MLRNMERKFRYEVIISDRARQLLADHMWFLAEKSPSAARDAQKRIVDAIRSLSQMPERYPFLNAEYIPRNKFHKMFVAKWYLILYQIKDQKVYIDFILDCRQDYSWLVR